MKQCSQLKFSYKSRDFFAVKLTLRVNLCSVRVLSLIVW